MIEKRGGSVTSLGRTGNLPFSSWQVVWSVENVLVDSFIWATLFKELSLVLVTRFSPQIGA